MSLRLRTALAGTLLTAAAVAAFALGVGALIAAGQQQQQDRDLAARLATATTIAPGDDPAPLDAGAGAIFIELVSTQGSVLFSDASPPPAVPASLLARAAGGRDAYGDGGPYRFAVRPRPGGYAVAGQARSVIVKSLAGLRGFLLLTAIVTIAAAAAVNWWAAGLALAPLGEAAATAEGIGADGDLRRRLPARAGKDDLARFSASFNAMLARLDEALAAQRRFTADASHRLRTPLTSIRANAALLSRDDLTPTDRREAAADISAEAERLTALAAGLLSLARAEGGGGLRAAPCDLGAIAAAAARRAEGLHLDRVVATDLQPAPLDGDAERLAEVADILLDNALRHTPPGGRVTVTTGPSGAWFRLAVADQGPGLPPGSETRVFERFVQAGGVGGGAGLGLAIARAVVEAHGGHARAGNLPEGGALFEVFLPPSHRGFTPA